MRDVRRPVVRSRRAACTRARRDREREGDVVEGSSCDRRRCAGGSRRPTADPSPAARPQLRARALRSIEPPRPRARAGRGPRRLRSRAGRRAGQCERRPCPSRLAVARGRARCAAPSGTTRATTLGSARTRASTVVARLLVEARDHVREVGLLRRALEAGREPVADCRGRARDERRGRDPERREQPPAPHAGTRPAAAVEPQHAGRRSPRPPARA